MLHSGAMELIGSILDQVKLNTIVDIGITALLIYWLFKLIRGTRAVRLVIGVSVLVLVYALAVAFDLRLLTAILQTGAVVGLFALVVVFQPELRRALERIGRVGSFGWLLSPADSRATMHVSTEVARAAAGLSADGQGALIVLQRETGLEEVAETGVMIHGDVSADLLRTIFTPRSPLHDGAVIIRDDRIVAAGALLPLAETSIHTERFGTRHRAALGITEQTDAVVVVVSEENGQISLVERSSHRPQPDRGRAGSGDPGTARSGRRPAWGPRLAVRRPRPAGSRDGRRDSASSAGSSGGRPRLGSHRRPSPRRRRLRPRRRQPQPRARQPATKTASASGTTPAASTPTTGVATPSAATNAATGERGAGQPQPKPPASTSGEADVVAPTAARAPR